MKDQLIFDVTDANTIAESDSVGAFVRSSDGTLITHTTVGGKEALDVNIASGVNVEVDLDHADDSVALGDGTNLLTSTTVGGDIGLDVNIINAEIAVTQGTDSPWAVEATDLDIRDLTHVSDSIKIGDGTDFLAVNADGSINITDNGGSITVDATDLDIRDLQFATDEVQIGNATGVADFDSGVTTAQTLRVTLATDTTITTSDAALADTAIKNDALAITAANTRESIVGTALTDRKYLFAYNADNRRMYIGSGTVTVANGFPVSPGSYIELRAGASVDVQVISEKVGHDVRTLELS
jgi:hypothetical protein